MPRKAFTVEEANRLLPLLGEVFARLDAHRAAARQLYDRIQVLDLLWGDGIHDPGNPDHAEEALLRKKVEAAVTGMERLVREEILGRGLRFPAGGLEHGLVDFPTVWRGRWVYLCWRRGEPALGSWHELDTGFSGRLPISEEHEREMGRGERPDDVELDF